MRVREKNLHKPLDQFPKEGRNLKCQLAANKEQILFLTGLPLPSWTWDRDVRAAGWLFTVKGVGSPVNKLLELFGNQLSTVLTFSAPIDYQEELCLR